MVKIFPTSFNFIEQQKILSTVSGEPVAITCSDGCVFVAQEDCLLEVFSIGSCKLVGQFRTVGRVHRVVYNPKGDCIVTLERKNPDSQGFSRVYFKWRGATVDKPARIGLLGSLSNNSALLPGDDLAVDIVELPGERNSSMTCLACCEESGRIAVGMGTSVRIFTLSASDEESEYFEGRRPSSGDGYECTEDMAMDMSSSGDSESLPRLKLTQSFPMASSSRRVGMAGSSRTDTPSSEECRRTPSSRGWVESHAPSNIELLLDIHTSMSIHSVAIFNNYVAFLSKSEVRVIKIALLADNSLQSSSGALLGDRLNFEDPTPAVSPAPTPQPDSAHSRKVRRRRC